MNKILQILVGLVSALFLFIGLRWVFDPVTAAAHLDLPLLEGAARSSQIGDMAAFFVGTALMMALALKTKNRVWFQAPALLLGLAACFRTVSWLVSGAALSLNHIVPEVILCLILVTACAKLSENS